MLTYIKNISKTGHHDSPIKNFSSQDVYHSNLKDLHDIIVAPHSTLALQLLQSSQFFDPILPEIRHIVEFKADKQFKSIWPHTLRVISQTPNKLDIRWAAFFHDFGKPEAYSLIDNKVTFYNHEHISARIFRDFAKKTRIFNSRQFHKINYLIHNLGWIEQYNRNWTDSAVRRFITEAGLFLDDLITLSMADITTGNDEKKQIILNDIEHLKTRIKEVREKDERRRSILPKGIGFVILDMVDGDTQRIGPVKTLLEQKVRSGLISPNQDIVYYESHLKDIVNGKS